MIRGLTRAAVAIFVAASTACPAGAAPGPYPDISTFRPVRSIETYVVVEGQKIPTGPLKVGANGFPPLGSEVRFLDRDGEAKDDTVLEPGDLVLVEYPKLLAFYEIGEDGAAVYRTSVSNNHPCPERTMQ